MLEDLQEAENFILNTCLVFWLVNSSVAVSILDTFYIVQLRKDGCQMTRKFWQSELLKPRDPLNSSDGEKQLMREAKMPFVAVPRYEGSEGGA